MNYSRSKNNIIHHQEKEDIVNWARDLKNNLEFNDLNEFTISAKKYFYLAQIYKAKNTREEIRLIAHNNIFKTRVIIEKSLLNFLHSLDILYSSELVLNNNIFGKSKKQGVSIRFSLDTCQPTSLCGHKCYAHDGLDAMPNSVKKGVFNTFLANIYECKIELFKEYFEKRLEKYINLAVNWSINEVANLENYERQPHIRFSHVGDGVKYPLFLNYLAQKIKDKSKTKVNCVAYTRHSKVNLIDSSLINILFTIDEASKNRIKLIPKNAQMVYTSFNNDLNKEALVNFIEHHPHHKFEYKGDGNICPTTDKLKFNYTSCDEAKCKLCFEK